MTMRIAALAFVLLTACASDDAAPERGGIGKADLFGSCSPALCDRPADFDPDRNCSCDDACHAFQDCCADKIEICGGPPCPPFEAPGAGACPDGTVVIVRDELGCAIDHECAPIEPS